MKAFFATPNPPSETKAPESLLFDSVVCALLNQPFEVLKFPKTFPAGSLKFMLFPDWPIIIVFVYKGPNMLAPILEIVPPTFNVPPIPAPPTTVKAPVVVEPEPVVLVTANPESDTIPEFGFTTNDVIVERPRPDPLLDETAVIKND